MRNFIFLSPNFPKNFEHFVQRLKVHGFNVLGIGSASYDELSDTLRGSLTEYFRVHDMENMDEMIRAVAFFIYKYGPIEYIESNNEHWLDLEATLREQFNIKGARLSDLEKTDYKSKMKALFKKAGAPVVPGQVVHNKEDLAKAIKKLKLPVIAKPDSGVGTGDTYKLADAEDVLNFQAQWNEASAYFIEKFVDRAALVTYDGLIDWNGNIIFETSFQYNAPTLDIIEGRYDFGYIIQKEIEPTLLKYGREIVKAFGMKGRFFHIEFFKQENGDYIALEYNNRVAGGNAIDSYNVAFQIDLYDIYARMMAGEDTSYDHDPAYGIYLGRQGARQFAHSEQAIYDKYGHRLVIKDHLPDIIARVMGHTTYIFRTDDPEEAQAIMDYVHARVETE